MSVILNECIRVHSKTKTDTIYVIVKYFHNSVLKNG